MSFHPRKEIRDSVKAILIAAETAAGTRVDSNRVLKIPDAKLPWISVYTDQEPCTIYDVSPRKLERKVSLVIQITARVTEKIDDDLDVIALEIEDAIDKDDTLAGKAADCVLKNTDLEIGEDGERLLGFLRLTYEVTYYSEAYRSYDDSSITDFKQLTWEIDPEDDEGGGGGSIEGELDDLDE